MFPMTIKIRGLEFVCANWAAVDELMKRYGIGAAESGRAPTGMPQANGAATPVPAGEDHDATLLRMFMDHPEGISASIVSQLLPKAKGRGVNPALRRWAEKMRLTNAESTTSVYVAAKVSGKRGWKLTPGAIQIANMNQGK
jgi:hypothetical protein